MKKTLSLLSTGLMAVGLVTGCGADNDRNGAMGDNNALRNVGYYTDRANPDDVTRNDVNDNNASLQNNRNGNDYNNVNNNGSVAGDSDLSRRIASQVARLNNVNDASAFTNGNTVVIGATLDKDVQNQQEVEQAIRSTAKNIARDKQVRVVTDKDMVDRISNINDRLDNGTPLDEVRSDITGVLDDLGDAVKRPFQNNAH
ncbi:lipoprotein YhcN [Pullulanibacillus pueri]|uniref:Lipoprotein YhcN n=2 Tax=Pullulanibacillus pueri TaxID=1437324 RepID=A0A8J2ZY31_9BACL|nr:lipoprotein YhcN [Pullulanibacillus pueri]